MNEIHNLISSYLLGSWTTKQPIVIGFHLLLLRFATLLSGTDKYIFISYSCSIFRQIYDDDDESISTMHGYWKYSTWTEYIEIDV